MKKTILFICFIFTAFQSHADALPKTHFIIEDKPKIKFQWKFKTDSLASKKGFFGKLKNVWTQAKTMLEEPPIKITGLENLKDKEKD
jgi:hypothetical protein